MNPRVRRTCYAAALRLWLREGRLFSAAFLAARDPFEFYVQFFRERQRLHYRMMWFWQILIDRLKP